MKCLRLLQLGCCICWLFPLWFALRLWRSEPARVDPLDGWACGEPLTPDLLPGAATAEPWPCPYCAVTFATRLQAQRHCKSAHRIEKLREGGERMCQIDDSSFTEWRKFYTGRARQCGRDSGTPWGSYTAVHFAELMQNVAQQLNVQDGASVFESGFGCGQLLSELSWIRRNLTVAGVDITPAMVEIGRRTVTSRSRLCHGNVLDLSMVPSDRFDHGITFGVFFYLPTTKHVCKAAKELLRVVKVGGSVWFGSHQDFPDYDLPPLPHQFWRDCLKGVTLIQFLPMRALLNSELYDPDRRYSVFVVK